MSLVKPWQLTGGTVILISGSRTIRSYWLFAKAMKAQLADRAPSDTILLQGEAVFGVDRLARIFAKRNGWRCVGWPAAWNTLGKRAGHVRNANMLLHSDALIAAWDGESKGTKNAIDGAERKGLPSKIVSFEIFPDSEDRNIKSLAKYHRLGDRDRSKIRIKGS